MSDTYIYMDSSDNSGVPEITVGMPVYNEARFIAKALESLVTQTHSSVEIIISDNGSTDGTESICRDFAARYEHIHYQKFEQNMGPAINFRHVLELAKGKYFIWAAGHDLWDQNYLEMCSRALERNPAAVLAFGATRWIDEYDQPYPHPTGYADTTGMSVLARYFTVFWGNMNPILGLIKTSQILVCPVRDTVGLDLIMLLQLSISGDFIHVKESNWSRREFREEISYEEKLRRYKSRDYGLGKSFFSRIFPFAWLPLEILRSVFSAELQLGTRLLMLSLLVPSLLIKYINDRYFR